MPQPKSPRLLACARCFRLKRKCDHAKPVCGECRRRGAECLPMKSRRDGEDITIPLSYLKYLESKVADSDAPTMAPAPSHGARDMGVQTEPMIVEAPAASPGGFALLLPDQSEALPRGSSPTSYSAYEPPLDPAMSPGHNIMLLSDPRSQAPQFDAEWISRLAYEVCQDSAGWPYFPQTDVKSLHAGYSFWLEEVYTNLYFSITHWVWPFLDSGVWKSWRQDCLFNAEADQWKGFFVKMVHAIGALSCDALDPDRGHAARAAELYSSALALYPYVMGQTSTVLQIQASIFMILYALHCPSPEEICTTVSSVVPFCTATMAELKQRAFYNGGSFGHEGVGDTGDEFTEPLFITCYMLNEIIVSGWDRPVSAAYRAVDDDMCSLSNEVPSSSSTSTALRHLFRLRKIQADIRRHWDEDPQHQKPSDAYKSALDAWRSDIPRYGAEEAPSTYLHPLWMANLYDYSILMLMQEKRESLEPKDIEDLLSASTEACLNFRRLQEEGQVMCYTWSALVFQFRTGVTLLYILWPDLREQRFLQQALEALFACYENVSHFADRWPDAVPYERTLSFLLRRARWIPDDALPDIGKGCSTTDLEKHLKQLKKQYIHKAVLRMIEDMVYRELT